MTRLFKVFANTELGANDSSLDSLNQPTSARLAGQAKLDVEINAANGNVLVSGYQKTFHDINTELPIGWVYNSQGTPAWRWGCLTQVLSLNDRMILTSRDGHETDYVYDKTRQCYIATQVSEGLCELRVKKDGSSQWTNVGTGEQVMYDISGREIARVDAAGNTTRIQYASSGDITFTLPSSQVVLLHKTTTGYSVHLGDSSTPALVNYTLDKQGRLLQTAVALNGNDKTSYQINYGYNQAGMLVGAKQTDGTAFSLQYKGGLVAGLSDGQSRQWSFLYNQGDAHDETQVIDPLKNVMAYQVNDQAVLASLRCKDSLGNNQVTEWTYNTARQCVTETRNNNAVSSQAYNTLGRVTQQKNGAGEITDLLRGSNGLVIAKTRYTKTGDDSTALTTRYVHNEKKQLIYRISATGMVTKFIYDAKTGLRDNKRIYLASAYEMSGLKATSILTQAALDAWSAKQPKDNVQLTDFSYNARGQCTLTRCYGHVDAEGQGILDDAVSSIARTWAVSGHWITKTVLQQAGSTETPAVELTSAQAFDGLSRLIKQTDASNQETSTVYEDTKQQSVTTAPNGLQTAAQWDGSGLCCKTSSSNGDKNRETTYTRDDAGRIFSTQHPNQKISYQLCDSQGRVIYDINSLGCVTQRVYNDKNRVIDKLQYATKIDVSQLVPGQQTVATGKVGDARRTINLYDLADRLVRTLKGDGGVTGCFYDNAGRETSSTQYETAVDFSVMPPGKITLQQATPASGAGDRITRRLFNADDKQTYEQDGEGYVVQYLRDVADQLKCTASYKKASAPGDFHTATLGSFARELLYRDKRGQITGEVDAENYLTCTSSTANGLKGKTVRYATPVDPTSSPILSQLIPKSDPEDHTVDYQYDTLNREIDAQKSNQSKVTKMYDVLDNVIKQTTLDTAPVKDGQTPDKKQFRYLYNHYGQILRELNPRANALVSAILADTSLTEAESQEKVIDIWNTQATIYAYDDSGLRLSETSPGGQTTFFYYNDASELVLSIGPTGSVREYTRNAFGDAESIRQYATPYPDSELTKLTGGFLTTAVSQNLQQNDAKDIVNKKIYDRCGQEEAVIDGEGYQTITEHNVFGELGLLIQSVDGQGLELTTQLFYDRKGLSIVKQQLGTDTKTTLRVMDRWEHDFQGNNSKHTNALGQISTQKHDGLNRVTDVTVGVSTENPAGYTESLKWGAFSQPKSHTNRLGKTTQYQQVQATRMTTITLPDGSTRTKKQNIFDQVIESTDENGAQTTTTYEPGGKLAKCDKPIDFAGKQKQTLSNEYNVQGWRKKTTHPDGVEQTFKHTPTGLLEQALVDGVVQKTQAYNALSDETKAVDAVGHITEKTHDRRHQISTILTDPAGLKHQQTFESNGLRQLASASLTDKNTLAPYVKQKKYDTFMRETKDIVDPDGLAITREEVLDDLNRCVVEIDGEGNKTYRIYDALNNEAYRINAEGGVSYWTHDAEGHKTGSYLYTNAIDLTKLPTDRQPNTSDISVLLTPDASDQITYFVYDDNGHLKYRCRADGRLIEYGNDKKGRPLKTTIYAECIAMSTVKTIDVATLDQAKKINAKQDRTTYRILNAMGYCRYLIDAKGYVIQKDYNDAGDVLKRKAFDKKIDLTQLKTLTPDAVSALVAPLQADSGNHITYHIYDDLGRLAYCLRVRADQTCCVDGYVQNALGELTTRIRYAASLAMPTSFDFKTIDDAAKKIANVAKDRKIAIEYDALGRPTKETYCPDIDTLAYSESWEYDALNHTIVHIDTENETWLWAYDKGGRKVLSATPEVETVSVVADAEHPGKYKSIKNPKQSLETYFEHDKNDALIQKTYAANFKKSQQHSEKIVRNACSKPTQQISDQWLDDEGKTITQQTDTGDTLTLVTRATRYDAQQRPIIKPNKANENTYLIYGPNGKKAYVVDAMGAVSAYHYNAFDQVDSMTFYKQGITLTDDMKANGISYKDFMPLLTPSLLADKKNRTVNVDYNQRGLKTSVKRPKREIYYPSKNALDYKAGTPTQYWTYNAFGKAEKVSTQVDASGKVFSTVYHRYDLLKNEIYTIDPSRYITERAFNADAQVSSKNEPMVKLPDNLDLDTCSNNAIQEAIVRTKGKDKEAKMIFNPAGHKEESQSLNVNLGTKDGKPVIVDKISTTYKTNSKGLLKAVTKPAVTGSDEVATEHLIRNPLSLIAQRIEVTRKSEDENGTVTTRTPTTVHQINPLGHRAVSTRYQDSTAIDQSLARTPVADGSEQETLKQVDDRGLLRVAQDPEGNVSQQTFTVGGLAARHWEFLPGWQQDLEDPTKCTKVWDLNLHLRGYDLLNRLVNKAFSHTHLGVTNTTTTAYQHSIFGEVTGEGESLDNLSIHRDYDNDGQLRRSNEQNLVPTIYQRDGMDNETLVLRSQNIDLMQVAEADVPGLIDKPMTQIMQTELQRDLKGHISVQRQPETDERESFPLRTCLTLGPSKAFNSSYAITWRLPPEKSITAELTLWPKGYPKQTTAFTAKASEDLFGVDVSAITADIYDYQLDYFFLDPQTQQKSHKPMRSASGTLPIDTGNNGASLAVVDALQTDSSDETSIEKPQIASSSKDALKTVKPLVWTPQKNKALAQMPAPMSEQSKSTHPIIKIENDNQLVVTGNTTGVMGVALYQQGKLVKKVCLSQTQGKYGADLSKMVSGDYEVKVITQVEALGKPFAYGQPSDLGVSLEYHQTVIEPKLMPKSQGVPLLGSEFYNALTWTDLPPMTEKLNAKFFSRVALSENRVVVENASTDFSNTVSQPFSVASYGSIAGPVIMLSVSCENRLYAYDLQQTLWPIGYVCNSEKPELTKVPPYVYVLPSKEIPHGDSVAVWQNKQVVAMQPLESWMNNSSRFDVSALGNYKQYDYQFCQLSDPIINAENHKIKIVTTQYDSSRLNLTTLNLKSFEVMNNRKPPSAPKDPNGMWCCISVLYQGNPFLSNGVFNYQQNSLSDDSKFKFMYKEIAIGPNTKQSFVDGIAGLVYGNMNCDGKSPISLSVPIYGDTINLIDNQQPIHDPKNKDRYTIPDKRKLFFNPMPTNVASAKFWYLDLQTSQWVEISGIKITGKHNVVVPAESINPGAYQYRLQAFDANNTLIDLSDLTTVDDNGYAIGEVTINSGSNSYYTTDQSNEKQVRPTRSQTVNRRGKSTQEISASGAVTDREYANGSHLLKEMKPTVEAMDNKGVVTKVRPTTTYLLNERKSVIATTNPHSQTMTHARNNAEKTTKTTLADGSSRQFELDGFSRATKTIKALPKKISKVIKSIENPQNEKVSKNVLKKVKPSVLSLKKNKVLARKSDGMSQKPKSIHPIIKIENDNQLVVTGNTDSVRGVALYRHGEFFGKVGVNLVNGKYIADLSKMRSGSYDVKLITQVKTLGKPFAYGKKSEFGVSLDYHQTVIEPVVRFNDETFYEAFTYQDLPPMAKKLNATFYSHVRCVLWVPGFDDFSHDFLSTDAQPIEVIPEHSKAENFGVAGENCVYSYDSQGKKWLIGYVNNSDKLDVTKVPPYIYTLPSKNTMDEMVSVYQGDQLIAVRSLAKWMNGSARFDATGLANYKQCDYQFIQLGEPDAQAENYSINIATERQDYLPMNVINLNVNNFVAENLVWKDGKFLYCVSVSYESNHFLSKSMFNYQQNSLSPNNAGGYQEIGIGPSTHTKIWVFPATVGYPTCYDGKSPMSLSVPVYGDTINLIDNEQPIHDPNDKNRYTVPDKRKLFFNPMPTNVASAKFWYLDLQTSQWIEVSEITITGKHNILVSAESINPGAYQYRLQAFDANNTLIDLSDLTTVDDNGYAIGEVTINSGSNSYYTTDQSNEKQVRPTRSQTVNRHGKSTQEISASGAVTDREYANGSHLLKEMKPTVEAMDNKGVVTKVRPTTTYLLNERKSVITTTNPNGQTMTHARDNAEKTTKTTLADGSSRQFELDGFSRATKTIKALPKKISKPESSLEKPQMASSSKEALTLKRKQPTPKYSGKIYQGKLKKKALLTFQEELINPDGDCAFSSLRTTRLEVAQILASYSGDISVRARFANIIKGLLRTECLLGQEASTQMITDEIRLLLDQHAAYDGIIAKLHSQLANECNANGLSAKDLIQKTPSGNKTRTAFIKARRAQALLDQQIDRHCMEKATYEQYTREIASHLWLSVEGIALYAKHENLTVHIWSPPVDQTNTLRSERSCYGSDPAKVMHLFFTAGYTHFNVLHPQSVQPVEQQKTRPENKPDYVTPYTPTDTSISIERSTYNKNNHVVASEDAMGWRQTYDVSSHGQQVAVTDGEQNTTRYAFDAQNQMLKRILPMGQYTEFTRDRNHEMLYELTANPAVLSDKYALSYQRDYAGNLQKKTDLSGETVTYIRNFLQQTLTQIGDGKGDHGNHYVGKDKLAPVLPQHLSYTYYASGLVAWVTDEAMNQETLYLYNINREPIGEWFKGGDGIIYQAVFKEVDALSRITEIRDTRYVMTRTYTPTSAIRCTKVSYYDGSQLQPMPEKDAWFDYNPIDLMTLANASYNTTTQALEIVSGKGLQLAYDNGYRISETTKDAAGNIQLKSLAYYLNGLLASTQHGDTQELFISDRSYRRLFYKEIITENEKGWWGGKKVTSHMMQSAYNANSWATLQKKFSVKSDPLAWSPVSVLTYADVFSDFNAFGNARTQNNQMTGIHDQVTTSYVGFDVQKPSITQGTRWLNKNGNGKAVATLTARYTSNGDIESVRGDIAETFRFFVSNHEGKVVLKRTGFDGGATEYYYYDIKKGRLGNAGNVPDNKQQSKAAPKNVDFTLNDKAVSENFPPPGPARYTVSEEHVTFSDIAQIFGDRSLGDRLATVNGYHADDIAPDGISLIIPQELSMRICNWSGVYLMSCLSAIIGSLYPNIAIPALKRPKHHHHSFWTTFVEVLVAVVVAYVAPELLVYAGVFASATAIGAVVVSAALADVAEQLTELAFHDESHFNWGELLTSMVTAYMAGNLSELEKLGQSASGFSMKAALTWTSVRDATAVSVMKEASAFISGEQPLSWKDAVFDIATQVLDVSDKNIANEAIKTAVEHSLENSVIDAVLQAAIYGPHLDWCSVGASAFGQAAGSALGLRISNAMRALSLKSLHHRYQQLNQHNQQLAKKVTKPTPLSHDDSEWLDSSDGRTMYSGWQRQLQQDFQASLKAPFGSETSTPHAAVSVVSRADRARQSSARQAKLMQHYWQHQAMSLLDTKAHLSSLTALKASPAQARLLARRAQLMQQYWQYKAINLLDAKTNLARLMGFKTTHFDLFRDVSSAVLGGSGDALSDAVHGSAAMRFGGKMLRGGGKIISGFGLIADLHKANQELKQGHDYQGAQTATVALARFVGGEGGAAVGDVLGGFVDPVPAIASGLVGSYFMAYMAKKYFPVVANDAEFVARHVHISNSSMRFFNQNSLSHEVNQMGNTTQRLRQFKQSRGQFFQSHHRQSSSYDERLIKESIALRGSF
jgi:YD repeat-containing protein